jgi:hypothetical protein
MADTPLVRIRENPVKKRERIAKISREMSMTVVRTGPDDKRGLLFGRIVAAGIKALRPEITEDISGMVIEAAATNVYRSITDILKALDTGALRDRVIELEKQLDTVPLPKSFDAKTISKMRTLRECGMSYKDVGKCYGMTAEECRGFLTGKWRSALPRKATAPDPKLPKIEYRPDEIMAAE